MKVTPVRLLRKADLPRVLAIEAEANPMPWREVDFLPFVAAPRDAAAAGESSWGEASSREDAPAGTAAAGEDPGGARAAARELRRGGALKVAWVCGDGGEGRESGEGTVRGFACAAAVADEVELQSLAVESSSRGRGLGSALMETVIEWAREAGFRTLHLEVRAGNRPALALYRRFGFAQAGVRPGYYQDNGEDALLLMREIGRSGASTGGGRAVPGDGPAVRGDGSAPPQDC